MAIDQFLIQSMPLGNLPDDWNIVQLHDITSKIGSGATPRGGEKVYQDYGIRLIRSQNVYDHEFHSDGLVHISDDDAKRLDNVVIESGDVLLNITGDSIARCCIVPKWVLPARVNQHVAIIRPTKRLNSIYLQKYLSHPKVKAYMLGHDAGGTRKALTKGNIESFVIPLPPIAEQNAIAHILGTLDDKIELNRQMNETLEAITRALFKSWFVDFDPVRAKMEGRQSYGMDAETAGLFPDSFEDSVLGEIPRGWRIRRVSDLIFLNREGLDPGRYPDEIFEHYSIPAFDEGWLPKKEAGKQIKSNKFIVPFNAVLLSKLNPNIPRIWFPKVGNVFRSVCSTEFLVTVPKTGYTCEFLYALFSSASFLDAFATLVTGTSGSHQRVKSEYLLDMDIVIPSSEIVVRFTEFTNPLYELISQNLKESSILAAIRDALLLKLLSGEIRVKNAEKFVEAKVS
jgi:type I restriction enzyme S subunit